MQIDLFDAAYRMGAYPVIGYTFLFGSITSTALTSFALNKIYLGNSSKGYPENYLSFNLKVSGIVGLSTGLLISYVAAKVLLKD